MKLPLTDTRSDSSKVPDFQRTWQDDAIVLGMLASILIGSFFVITPAASPPEAEPVAEIVMAETVPEIPAAPPQVLPDSLADKETAEPPTEPSVKPAHIYDEPVEQDRLLPSGDAFITLFGEGYASKKWYQADRNAETGFWLNDFRRENINYSSEGLSLTITEKAYNSPRPWTAAEIGTRQEFGYGRYETIMKPASGSGLISSFFTYTGPYFGKPHDEIDIEFLGRDTRQVHFNMFRKGKSYAPLTYDLPFDAAEAFHLYAFEWHPDGIAWYIDNEMVYHVSAEDYPLPATPGFLMMNIWTGKMPAWHGRARFESGTSADYACVSYRPIASSARSCADFYKPPATDDSARFVRIASTLIDIYLRATAKPDTILARGAQR